MGIASIIKKTPQTETRTRVSVRYDSILCMFIIQDRNNDKTLEPAMSVIDLLDRVHRDKLEIVDVKATFHSMTHYFILPTQFKTWTGLYHLSPLSSVEKKDYCVILTNFLLLHLANVIHYVNK